VEIVAPTPFLGPQLMTEGLLGGPPLHASQEKDIAMGFQVARKLGEVDVGQTVVVKNSLVMALETIEGTDATIRRGGKLGGKGALVIKRAKPGQDERFDLPAVGIGTLEAMREVGAQVLALHAGKTLVLDVEAVVQAAEAWGISVVGWRD
jgi:UDP-2,3-diacylglucosamine hydrolase